MTTTINTAMKDNGRRAWKGAAFVLSVLVYLAGLIYAGVRSFDLFARTVPADLLALATLGILAMELTALGLPLALHFWTAPGPQRTAAFAFYVLDLLLITANAILDAAHQAGEVLPGFMAAYGVYAVPALPVLAMIGWAIVWALDPASREADMRAAVEAATQESLMSQIIEATKSIDITAAVQSAAEDRARAIVGETLGRAPRRAIAPPAAGPAMIGGHGYNTQAPAGPVAHDDETQPAAEAAPVLAPAAPGRPHSNGTARKARGESAGPK